MCFHLLHEKALVVVDPPENFHNSMVNDQTNRDIYDENGDLLVKSDSKQFLVSSKVLELASPVFETIFKSCFREG